MGLNLTEVHKYEKVKGKNEARLTRVTPYIRLKSGRDEPPVFLQEGKVYTEAGDEVLDRPSWFDAELKKLSVDALAEIGFDDNAPRRVTVEKPKNLWVCPTCQETMPLKNKGFHVARHKRENHGNDSDQQSVGS